MDLQSGYHQILLNENSRHFTAFSTDSGFYQWKVLPFGLNIAPGSFSRMMAIAFAGLKPHQAFTYMDDLIGIGFTENQHINNLRRVFQVCRDVNLKLNPNKCEFFKHEVYFLGHKCTQNGLLPDEKKTSAMLNYERPRDKDAVKRFVAFANYYRRFIKNFADIARPLSSLTRKKIEFVWNEECEIAFQKLKNSLISAKLLAYPDFEKEFKVTVDAIQYACGSVLSQLIDGADRPIQYISKPIIEKELLAIHFAITVFRPYLYGQKFTVFSDHKPLIYLYSLKNPASELTRIRLDLKEYDFVIHHIKGKDNVVADALSRISISELKECIFEENSDNENLKKPSETKTVKKKLKQWPTNKILAITRSMSKTTKSAQENGSYIIELVVPPNKLKAVEELQCHNRNC